LKRLDAQTGSITLIQCFGPAANLNIHLHCLVLDGAYRIRNGVPEFHSVRSPATAQLQGAAQPDYKAHHESIDPPRCAH
jgi:hypothetical protein